MGVIKSPGRPFIYFIQNSIFLRERVILYLRCSHTIAITGVAFTCPSCLNIFGLSLKIPVLIARRYPRVAPVKCSITSAPFSTFLVSNNLSSIGMPGPRGNGPKRGGTTATLTNGHGTHTLSKKRSQKFESASHHPTLGGRRNSLDVEVDKSGSGDSTPDRDSDAKRPPGSSASASSGSLQKELTNAGNATISDLQNRIHVGQSPGTPNSENKNSEYASVLPPHQYLDSLAITFFLINLPTIFLVLVHVLFVIFAVSPYSSATDRYSSWKTILPAEGAIILFFALVSPSIRAYITELAEPVIASSLAGNGGRGAAISAAVMFAAGRLPNVILNGFVRLKRYSPGGFSDTFVLTAKELDTKHEVLDRLGDELQAWLLAIIRQLIAIHVVARWSWEGLKRYLTNRVNQSKLEDATASANIDTSKKKKEKAVSPTSTVQMPLWTTIANNYIVATKDQELKPPEDLSTYIVENECCLHIQEITSCSVRIRAKGQRAKLESILGDPSAFDVSVNGLQWREISVSIEEGENPNDETMYHQQIIRLYLDIQALVPSTANEIEITNTSLPEPVILFHATICTTQKEATAPTAAPQTVRPNSPISTLTDKLNNAIENLNNLKNNQKRIRRDHKSTVTSLRSEIDALHSRLEAPDKGEERARRGNLALKYHIMQTEDKIRTLEDEIHNAEDAINDRQKELISSREKWESERSALEASRRSQHTTKSSFDKFLQQFHAEKMAINARKEKLTSREVKLKGELEILEAAERKKDEQVDDRSRRRREARAQLIKERQTSQAEQVVLVEQMESHLAEIKERTARTHSERIGLESMPVVSPSPPSHGIIAPSPTLSTTSPFPGVSAGVQNGSRHVSGSFEDALEGPLDALMGLENDFVYK